MLENNRAKGREEEKKKGKINVKKMPSHHIKTNIARKSVHIQLKWFRISFCFSIIEHEHYDGQFSLFIFYIWNIKVSQNVWIQHNSMRTIYRWLSLAIFVVLLLLLLTYISAKNGQYNGKDIFNTNHLVTTQYFQCPKY